MIGMEGLENGGDGRVGKRWGSRGLKTVGFRGVGK